VKKKLKCEKDKSPRETLCRCGKERTPWIGENWGGGGGGGGFWLPVGVEKSNSILPDRVDCTEDRNNDMLGNLKKESSSSDTRKGCTGGLTVEKVPGEGEGEHSKSISTKKGGEEGRMRGGTSLPLEGTFSRGEQPCTQSG